MKTAHILSLTAAGALGSLLLGGGAFAVGAAIGSDARDDRIQQVQQRAHERVEQGQQGQGKPGAGRKNGDRGQSGSIGDNHRGGKTGHGSGDGSGDGSVNGSGDGSVNGRQHDRPSTPMGAQFGPGAGVGKTTMSEPDNLGITSDGL